MQRKVRNGGGERREKEREGSRDPCITVAHSSIATVTRLARAGVRSCSVRTNGIFVTVISSICTLINI